MLRSFEAPGPAWAAPVGGRSTKGVPAVRLEDEVTSSDDGQDIDDYDKHASGQVETLPAVAAASSQSSARKLTPAQLTAKELAEQVRTWVEQCHSGSRRGSARGEESPRTPLSPWLLPIMLHANTDSTRRFSLGQSLMWQASMAFIALWLPQAQAAAADVDDGVVPQSQPSTAFLRPSSAPGDFQCD